MDLSISRVLGPRWSAACVWLACWFALMPIFTMPYIRLEDGVSIFQPYQVEPLRTGECPRNCEDLFGKLEPNSASGGGKKQEVYITQRGEPKSGTGLMMGKTTEALAHFCHYLQTAYGEQSCRIEMPTNVIRILIFEPHLGDGGAPCSCNTVDRVLINFSAVFKHAFPVDREKCPWSHSAGTMDPSDTVCTFQDGGRMPEDRIALWNCVKNTPCAILDDNLQMAVMRDPREVAVSTYYFWARRTPKRISRFKSMDEFYLASLPTLCKWLSVRYLLFEELLRERSLIFWYDDAVSNPAGWYSQFFSFVGLTIPPAILDETVHAHDEGGFDLGFHLQKLDDHPNGTISRSYKDEVSAQVVKGIDDILRRWLPPEFLNKIGMSN